MDSPSSPALRRLHRLDGSSSEFHDKLCDVLSDKEYAQCVPNLEGSDLIWLIDYIDEVRGHIVLLHFALRLA